MRYSRRGNSMAVRYVPGENELLIMDMYKEHGKIRLKGSAIPGALCLVCADGKYRFTFKGAEIKKGDWFIIDENGWGMVKIDKVFKKMFLLEPDLPLPTPTPRKKVAKAKTQKKKVAKKKVQKKRRDW